MKEGGAALQQLYSSYGFVGACELSAAGELRGAIKDFLIDPKKRRRKSRGLRTSGSYGHVVSSGTRWLATKASDATGGAGAELL